MSSGISRRTASPSRSIRLQRHRTRRLARQQQPIRQCRSLPTQGRPKRGTGPTSQGTGRVTAPGLQAVIYTKLRGGGANCLTSPCSETESEIKWALFSLRVSVYMPMAAPGRPISHSPTAPEEIKKKTSFLFFSSRQRAYRHPHPVISPVGHGWSTTLP